MQTKENVQVKKSGKGRKGSKEMVGSCVALGPAAEVAGVASETTASQSLVLVNVSSEAPQEEHSEVAAAPKTDVPALQEKEHKIEMLNLNKIVNSTYNPRKDFREESLLELADSIRQVGVLQPICVRPKDEGYEIVYGERRYWAAALADLKFIPALVRDLTDAEAEDAAITENLQREDVKPREEAAAYKRALQSGRHTIESLIGKFGKSESYIRSRLKLCELIDALAEQLDKEEISVGVATEIAKYDASIQQEVFDEHFAEGCYSSWKNARIKEIAKRLYDKYMTKLEAYRFDKTECQTCMHNTANQVLFKDACDGGCAGCQNRECMIRKNEEFLLGKALKLQKDDPRTMLATAGETPAAVLQALEKEGYHVVELQYDADFYDEFLEMPEAPMAENYDSEESYASAMEDYEGEVAHFTEETQKLEFDISEGRMRKYAIIGNLDVDVRYEQIEEQEQEVVVDSAEGERKVLVTVIPPSPLEALEQQDHRNRQLCYEHITVDMKHALSEIKVSNKPLQKEEAHMFHYAIMQCVHSESKLKQCGFRPKEDSWLSEQEQFAAAGRITSKQQAALMRAFLINFFRSSAPENHCTDQTLKTKLLCRFADLNFEEQSRAVQQKYLNVYEMRKARLQEQIDALKAQEEAAAMEAMQVEEPDYEPEEQPEESPAEDPSYEPEPIQEPESFPIYPYEPDTHEYDLEANAA